VATALRVRDAATRRAEWAILRGQGSADLRRLRRVLPRFPSSYDIRRAADDLGSAYRTYVRDVSTPGMAASLQAGAFLLALCRNERITSAIDLGSGFSSYVLRRWASEAECVVCSVDDDPIWLARTQGFLAAQHLAAGSWCAWPDIPDRAFDLVFHDLAHGTRREEAMPAALRASSRLAVFDDAQLRRHRAAMRASCGEAGVELFSLRAVTLDDIKRYSMLAIK
jgi:hypothetical protein